MTPAIAVSGLTRRYRDHVALHDVSMAVEGEAITGLLGRNGAGKTTLLRILAGQEFASAGDVRVLGGSPVENENVCSGEWCSSARTRRIRTSRSPTCRAASWFYPNWDAELADSLLSDFDLRPGKTVRRLSRGMRSALGITVSG